MKLVLHIGMGKTGTSALQQALRRMQAPLLERGVLYPSTKIKITNHNFLVLLTENPDHAPGIFRTKILQDPSYLNDYVLGSWDSIQEQIAKHRPKKVILSAENLFFALKHDTSNRLIDKLTSLTDDIAPIAYVRQPSRHYLSKVQQRIKNSAVVEAPGPAHIQAPIEAWERALGIPVQTCLYDRKFLHNEDSTADFLYRMLERDEYEGIEIPANNVNESLSAEAMAILQDFRRSIFPGQDGLYFDSSTTLRRLLTEMDDKVSPARPSLHAEIADHVDHSSTDLLWLKDEKGIEFSGVDYSRIGSTTCPASYAQDLSISDICPVDLDRKNTLAAIAFDALYQKLRAEQQESRERPAFKEWLSRITQ